MRPIVTVFLGLNVRHRERLPTDGPAILVANHNSHLDTVVLMALLRPALLSKARPVAAADYFLRNRLLAWFALRLIHIIPIDRSGGRGRGVLAEAEDALQRSELVLIFPEGTRGEPERRARLKNGVAFLAKSCPSAPVIPVFFHGLGKSLPKGAVVPIPFFVDVFVGHALQYESFTELATVDDPKAFTNRLEARLDELAAEGRFPEWT